MNLLFDYAVALTNLNGVIHKEKVVEIYNMQNENGIEVSDIESLMIREEVNLRKHFVEVEDSYFVHESIFHFGEIESLLQRKANKPYYIPKKELLLCYKDDEFYEENKQTKKLYRLLEKYVQPDNVNSVGKNIRSVVCEWIIKADIRGKHFLSWYFLLGLAKQVKPIDPVWQIMRKGEVRPNLVLREK